VVKAEEGENTLQAPTFEIKSWRERYIMSPAELSQYMIDLRGYYAEKARYAQQHT